MQSFLRKIEGMVEESISSYPPGLDGNGMTWATPSGPLNVLICRLTLHPSFRGTALVYSCFHFLIINSTSFHSQECLYLDDKNTWLPY